MDGWRALHLIPQLKWSLLATGQAVLNETDLATLILNMLIRMCEYYPSRSCGIMRISPNTAPFCSDKIRTWLAQRAETAVYQNKLSKKVSK